MVNTQIEFKYCIRNITAVCNPRQKSVRDKIQSKTKLCRKKNLLENKFCWKKNSQIEFVMDFQHAFLSCLGQIDAYHH